MSEIDDLKARIVILERIIVMMNSGAKFALGLDEFGRPKIVSEDWGNLPKRGNDAG